MPIKSIDIRKDIPRATRKRRSVLKETEEWRQVVTKLSHGLKPNEGIQIILTNDTLKQVKNAPRLFRLLLERYVKELKLDYDVFQRGSTPEGIPILYVAGRSGKVA